MAHWQRHHDYRLAGRVRQSADILHDIIGGIFQSDLAG